MVVQAVAEGPVAAGTSALFEELARASQCLYAETAVCSGWVLPQLANSKMRGEKKITHDAYLLVDIVYFTPPCEGCVTERVQRRRARPLGQSPLLADINPLLILETTHVFSLGHSCALPGRQATLKGLTLYVVASITGPGPSDGPAPAPAERLQAELLWDGPRGWGEPW